MVARFEIVGSRTDKANLLVDMSYRDTPREAKALSALLGEIREETGVKHAVLGTDDSQRYAFAKILSRMLQFADEGNFARGLPEKDRQKKLRVLAASVDAQMTSLVQEHRHRRVMPVSFSRPDAQAALLKALTKILNKAG